ncbi:MAG: glycosyltransferase, partial [Bacteroidia bacterium]
MKALIIGHVWPEPGSSAAGVRINEIMQMLYAGGWNLTFACAAQSSEFVRFPKDVQVDKFQIELNSNAFDFWIAELMPDLVVFDRFMTEEQYGWRVAERIPQAVRVLDTEDLHFLRHTRAKRVQNKIPLQKIDFFGSYAFREIAAIYRSDLSLIISNPELELLMDTFKIPNTLLKYLPFCRPNQLHVSRSNTMHTFE